MKFQQQPENDFLAFVREYYQRCHARVPQICVAAAKWKFEDLIPGLSDVDTRFLVKEAMSPEQWRQMSLEVGGVHAEMCRENHRWARTLEHLPGINLTVDEIADPALFYPEFRQWTFYEGDEATIAHVKSALAAVDWSSRDERHHLKRFATFFGPYQRGIDPPVNLGPWENKYALHSRFMHYFAPPLQAAVSLQLRRNVAGKLDSLRLARTIFPNAHVIDEVLAAIDCHYEAPGDYAEPRLTEIENQLAAYLRIVWGSLNGRLKLCAPCENDDVKTVRAKIAAIPADPTAEFFEGAKFGRLLEGRLRFYAEEIPWFDSAWPIRIELQRIVANFYTKPLSVYGQLRFGERLTAEEVLERLSGTLLGEQTCRDMRRFAEIASESIAPGDERRQARAVADVYQPVLVTCEALGADLLLRVKSDAEFSVAI